MRYFAGLLVALSVAGFAGGYGVAVYFNHPTYNGPPVAGFTTGGLRCSPICGSLSPNPHAVTAPGQPEPRPPERESNGLALGLGLGSGHGAGIGIGPGF